MEAQPLLRCTECGRISQRRDGEIKYCEARKERGAVHNYEVCGE